jgi:high affinity cGMP-specific 3',5'-cyclic phosphodiesterase 9
VNNAFLIATRSELARTYNDTSVLESHHLATLYHTIGRPELDIFRQLDASKWREVRKQIINAVIHTDMTFHFPLVSKVPPPPPPPEGPPAASTASQLAYPLW